MLLFNKHYDLFEMAYGRYKFCQKPVIHSEDLSYSKDMQHGVGFRLLVLTLTPLTALGTTQWFDLLTTTFQCH